MTILYAHPGRLPALVRACESLNLTPLSVDPVFETIELPHGEQPGPILTHLAVAVDCV